MRELEVQQELEPVPVRCLAQVMIAGNWSLLAVWCGSKMPLDSYLLVVVLEVQCNLVKVPPE